MFYLIIKLRALLMMQHRSNAILSEKRSTWTTIYTLQSREIDWTRFMEFIDCLV